MRIKSSEDVFPEKYVEGVEKRRLIHEYDGAKNFYMRLFVVDRKAPYPPPHSHPWEHEIYVLDGRGTLIGDEGEFAFKSGDVIFIPPNERHQLKQDEDLRFI